MPPLLLLFSLLIVCVCTHVSVGGYVHMSVLVCGGQKRLWDSLVLRTELGSLQGSFLVSTAECLSSPANFTFDPEGAHLETGSEFGFHSNSGGGRVFSRPLKSSLV